MVAEVALFFGFGLLSEKEEIKALHQPKLFGSKLGESATRIFPWINTYILK